MEIVIGVDQERPSLVAVDWLAGQEFARDAHIRVVTAFDLLVSDPVDDAELLESTAARLRGALPDATIETRLVDRGIPQTLREQAEGADLLVVGSHRSRHTMSELAGALPRRIAESAPCPVVVVPDDWDHRGDRIVAGVADDESSDDALEFAARLAERSGAPLRLVHLWQRPVPATDPVGLYLDVPVDLREAHRERLAEVARDVGRRHPDVDLEEQLHEGSSRSAFVPLGRVASLVVLGSHRHGPIAAWLLGSTVRSALADCRTPVCVVPPGSRGAVSGMTADAGERDA